MKYRIDFIEDIPKDVVHQLQVSNNCCVALKHNDLIGYARYSIYQDTLECTELYVADEHLGRGILAGIILKLENKAFDCGKCMLEIKLNVANKYKKYFVTRGFALKENKLIKRLTSK